MDECILFSDGLLTVDVEDFLNTETAKEIVMINGDINGLLSATFHTNTFYELHCEELVENTVNEYFEISSVDEYVESERLYEAIKSYIINNKVKVEKIILI